MGGSKFDDWNDRIIDDVSRALWVKNSDAKTRNQQVRAALAGLIAVARILGNGVRQRTRVFSELQSHYVFADRFGRPDKGNDKGKVEGLVGWTRRNLLVPVPRAASFTALNEQLLEGCQRRLGDRLRGHKETISERLVRDLAAFHSLPPAPYDACEKKTGRVSSLSLVRYRGTD
jgi:hypothetical protein